MDNWTIWPVELEIRQRGGRSRIRGAFPYGASATIADRGRQRKEQFAPNAFSFSVNDEAREVHLLSGHSYEHPLASKRAGTLELEDTNRALNFEATLPLESDQPSWVRDSVLALRNGLVGGVSPGFRVPPPNVVPDAEVDVPEPGNPGVSIRLIRAAVLLELSLVTRPAYPTTAVAVRSADQVGGRDLERYYRWL